MTNHVPNNPADAMDHDQYLSENKRIEDAIAELQKDPNDELLAYTLTVIRQRMRENGHLIIAVDPKSMPGSSQIQLQTIQTVDGRNYLAAFTSFDEELKGNNPVMSTFTAPIHQAFLAALNEPSVQGLIINPWNRTLILNKAFIQIILGTENQDV